MSSNDPTASVTKQGMVTSGDRGEAFILARFATCSVGAQMIVIPDGLKYERPKLVENNYVDTLVNDKLDKLRMFPSGICSDPGVRTPCLHRRGGRAADTDEVKGFVAEANPKKRDVLVEPCCSARSSPRCGS